MTFQVRVPVQVPPLPIRIVHLEEVLGSLGGKQSYAGPQAWSLDTLYLDPVVPDQNDCLLALCVSLGGLLTSGHLLHSFSYKVPPPRKT